MSRLARAGRAGLMSTLEQTMSRMRVFEVVEAAFGGFFLSRHEQASKNSMSKPMRALEQLQEQSMFSEEFEALKRQIFKSRP